MTPRCRRALRHGVNVMDSKHHSKVYCQRLEKYAYRHGMAIGIPGFRQDLVTEKILIEKYVYVQGRDLLLKIDQHTRVHLPGSRINWLDSRFGGGERIPRKPF